MLEQNKTQETRKQLTWNKMAIHSQAIHIPIYILYTSNHFLPITSFSPPPQFLCFWPLSSLLYLFVLNISVFSLCTLHLFFCWIEGTQPVRRRPGIFLCPSSPTLSTDTLSLPGCGSVGCGHGSALRATTPPLPSFICSDSALLRKSVSFTEDLLLAASGIVGLLCVIK